MEAVDWYTSNQVLDSWKAAFRAATPPFDGKKVSPKKEDSNIWAYFNTPYPEIHLIAFAFNPSVGPPRVQCRVWIYKEHPELREKILSLPLTKLINKEALPVSNPRLNPSWKRQLDAKGIEVIGIQYDIVCSDIFPVPSKGEDQAALERMEGGLTRLCNEFLAWVDKAYFGEPSGEAAPHPESPASLHGEESDFYHHPEESPASGLYQEGSVKQVLVNAYERNRDARDACIAHYHPVCQACDMDFREVYGEFAAGFIHVHHEVPLHTIAETYQVVPEKDLKPVCPNCHSVLHMTDPPMPVVELRALLESRRNAKQIAEQNSDL
ncbi:HNH endonuclease [Pseudomonas aeruginosa]